MTKKSGEQFSKKEAEQRLVAALRGARLVGPKPMKDIPKKRAKPKKQK